MDGGTNGVLDNMKYHSTIEELQWSYVGVEQVCKQFSKLHRFERVRKIMLDYNGLDQFTQLNDFHKLPPSVTEVVVHHNAVARMNLFRYYIAYRLRNIAVVNGVRITDAERLKGHRLFSIGVGKHRPNGGNGGGGVGRGVVEGGECGMRENDRVFAGSEAVCSIRRPMGNG